MFLNFAKVKKFIKENNMENIKKLKVEETKRELFTLAEIKNVFSYDNYNYNAKEVFKILLYTSSYMLTLSSYITHPSSSIFIPNAIGIIFT